MKKLTWFVFGVIILFSWACSGKSQSGQTFSREFGPFVDKVIFQVVMDQTVAIKDTVEGKTDVFFTGLNGSTFKGIDSQSLSKLEVYAVPSGSWSLLTNPIPNAAPYVHTIKDGRKVFNPFAIREVRYALNWLINRKKLVEEVLKGTGEPMFTPMTPGQPGTYRYNLVAANLGMTEEGNERWAMEEITRAMEKASALPENKGKLLKSGQFWTYEGNPVTVLFVIRVDDPTGRLPAGHYIADQLEKAGFKVERLLYDRSKAAAIVYRGNPADYEWTLYTEGWGAGATRRWWDVTISQMYAPYYGYMPGGAMEGFWNYQNDEIDRLAKKSYNGWFLTREEYWKDNLQALKLGLQDSVRVYLVSQMQYFVANKGRFYNRMLYGLGDGLNGWSIRSAQVKENNKGEKVLRISQHSARGGLFMSAWDPVGVNGFSDVYSTAIVSACTDPSTFEAPNDASDTPLRVSWDIHKVSTQIERSPKGKPLGKIPVPREAILYNSQTKQWESGIEYKETKPGTFEYVKINTPTAYSQVTSTYLYGNWHSGEPVTLADLMYAAAFAYEWANKDGEEDKYYDQAYASQYQPSLQVNKGVVLNLDGSFTSYFDFNWPMDPARVAANGVMSPKAGNPGRPTLVSWEITEALAKLVVEGSKSGTIYSFSGDPAFTEVDVINPTCVGDIKAKLEEFISTKYVPSSIRKWVSEEEALKRYRSAIRFIDTYKNAYISNGPFFISQINYQANYIELSAFREGYPYTPDYWVERFKTKLTRINSVRMPPAANRNQDLTLEISVSRMEYPEDLATLADVQAKVVVTLVLNEEEEKEYPATFVKGGVFRALIPAKDLGGLTPGTYPLVVQSYFAEEVPSVVARSVVLLP
ncbi:MAG: ABC transporter substrate-binding protein [Spirochaetales bacterium]